MRTTIPQKDLENPQRCIAEGLGAPEAEIISTLEAKAQESAGDIHRLCSQQ
ncbi:MAG TPA: hypothetical protein VJI15_05260 [Candidatus Nanoarchaeia archaeon]|nr:hypothetical protein [Candidatus Nanoarchaeia archaeon]